MIKRKKNAGIQKKKPKLIYLNRPRRFAGKHRKNKHILAFSYRTSLYKHSGQIAEELLKTLIQMAYLVQDKGNTLS